MDVPRSALAMQPYYYIATGVWPIVRLRSFEAVTGRKRDRWLVRMVGLLAASIGVSLIAGRRRGERRTTTVLAATSALAFAAIELWYAGRGRKRAVYAADGLLELGIALAAFYAA